MLKTFKTIWARDIQSYTNPGSVVALLQGNNYEFKEISEKKMCGLVAIRKTSAWLFAILYLFYVKESFFPLNRHCRTLYVNQKKLSEQTTPKEHFILYLLYLLKKNFFCSFSANSFPKLPLNAKTSLIHFFLPKKHFLDFFKEIKVLNRLLLMNFRH